MVVDYSKRSFKVALLVAVIAEILGVVAIATPVWTAESGVEIGLWQLKTVDTGRTYSWSNTGEYEDFYYSAWMMGVRGSMMAGVIIGFLGILFNCYVLKSKKRAQVHGNTLMCYYFLAFTMVISGVATYVCKIPQSVDSRGEYYTGDDENMIADYIFKGGYGYSLWFGWVGAGVFLPAAGLAYEGSNQKRAADRLARYRE